MLGDILFLRKKLLSPKMTDLGKVFYVNFNGSFELYLVHDFVYESINGMEDHDGVIKHIDGDKKNNSITNLELVL